MKPVSVLLTFNADFWERFFECSADKVTLVQANDRFKNN
jgi:hypothetical protein